MKKLLTVLLAALLILGGAALPKMAAAEGEQIPEFKTLADAFPYDTGNYASTEDLFMYIINVEGTWLRVEADITADVFERLNEIDFFDEEREAKEKALLKDLPVKAVINLSELMFSQKELDALAGKKGQELLDMGFVPSGSYGFWEGGSTVYLAKGPFEYEVNFVEILSDVPEYPNLLEIVAPMTVKDAAFATLSNYATEPEFDPNGGPVYEYWAPDTYSIPEVAVEESPFKTVADVFAAMGEAYSYSYIPERFAAAFALNDVYYRVEAELPEGMYEQIEAIDFFDETREEQLKAMLSPLPVTRVGDLTSGILTQEELDALVGLTGQDLLDMGFEYGMGYSFWDKAEMYLENGLYEYHFFFNETVPEMEDYDAALDEIMQTLTVAKAEFFQLSSVCSDPDLLW